jgi:beta-glucosidase
VSACVKHWIFNSQETNRSGMSSHVAERVGRELYEPPYAAAVDAGVGFVMCSFNRINGSIYSCANGAGLNAWLKADLAFDGAVVSDWGATHGTADFSLGGLDIEQEWVQNSTYFGANLAACVANGTVPAARLDDMALRSLRAAYALGFAAGAPGSANASAPANTTAHASLAADVARASLVLLKNDGALPLAISALPRGVAVFGQDSVVGGGGSGAVVPPYLVRARDGIAAALGPGANVTYLAGNRDELASGAVAALARASDVAVVVVAVGGGEGSDRANLSASCAPWAGAKSCTWWPDQDALVAAVAAANAFTVVVTRTPGAVLMPWLGAVRAVIHQGFPGQEAGTALGEALAGALNPRGRLTISFPRTLNDTWLSADGGGPILPERWPGVQLPGDDFSSVFYDEGLFVGYRHYDARPASPPLFPFGHGLSYTTFAYSGLSVAGFVGPNSSATVTANIAHAGGPAGAELAQLYVAGALPGDPPKALKGWQRATLAPGAAQNVSFTLSSRDLTVWSAAAHAHVAFPAGSYALWVGASAADLRLAGSVEVRA